MLTRKKSLRLAYAEKLRTSGQTGKTPPRGAMARGNGIRRVSNKRAAANRVYATRRREFMAANPMCHHCGQPSTELHHSRGRAGALLVDTRYFIALCGKCHDNVHEHPAWAREAGLLANAAEWNTTERKYAQA